jgi:ABC-type phosphate transport system ATPase subunit
MNNPNNSNSNHYAIEIRDTHIYYGSFRAVKEVNLQIEPRKITAIIGPSGCGKSTVLRALNRMNDFVPSARLVGEVLFHGQNIYASDIDPVEVRRVIGMVFQKPTHFQSQFMRMSRGERKSTVSKATPMTWWKKRCGKQLCGMR